jgi:hypothetical protein
MLHITNVMFPSEPHHRFVFPTLTTLESLYIDRATYLSVHNVAALVCSPSMHNLRLVRLAWCYRGSYSSERILRRDIEREAAWVTMNDSDSQEIDTEGKRMEERMYRVREVVICPEVYWEWYEGVLQLVHEVIERYNSVS